MGAQHDRVVRDNVHRDIVLPDDIGRLVDTKTFQRLREIKQLATCHFVFPTATHTRFVHSLGVQHLAGALLESLEHVHPGLISPLDKKLVQYAALLHDIGHPPFSHAFETPDIFATYRHHEDWARVILQDEGNDLRAALIGNVGEDGLQRMLDIMSGDVEIPALHEMISSQLDVDRLDYLMRDQINTGAKVGSFDVHRLFRATRIGDDGGLTITRGGVAEVESYLMMRYHMYHNVYFHKVNMLTQTYYVRALTRARVLAEAGEMQLSPRMWNMLCNPDITADQYLELTDAVIQAEVTGWLGSQDEELCKWASLICSRSGMHKRIRVRDLTDAAIKTSGPAIMDILTAAGHPSQDFITARVGKEGYRPYVRGIIVEGGQDISEFSAMVRSIVAPANDIMLFVPEDCREACEKVVEDALAGG
jgi:HD superfamily phosphohydrolase